jgi:hypothetical protein
MLISEVIQSGLPFIRLARGKVSQAASLFLIDNRFMDPPFEESVDREYVRDRANIVRVTCAAFLVTLLLSSGLIGYY